MGRYFGNLTGRLNDIAPEMLNEYGFEGSYDFLWTGCGCSLDKDDDEDYCHNCYESAEQHEEEHGEEPEIIQDCTYSCVIDKKNFESVALPWLRANEHIKQYVTSLEFGEKDHSVCLIEVTTLACPDQKALGVYILLKQVEYFFEKSSDDSCGFGIEIGG
jgi:hypothetical protein